MKKVFIFVVLITGMVMATPKNMFSQTGVHITVLGQLLPGTLTPAGGTTSCYNSPAGLITGTAPTGGQGNYTHQWQSSIDGGITWNNIVGATGVNYDPGNLTANIAFRRQDNDGCGSVYTNTISFTVYGQFLAGVTTGGNSPLCSGGNGGTLTSTAESGGAPGTTYQWQSSIDGGATWNNIAGETTLALIVGTPATTTSYRLAFINPTCGTVYGNIITITVYPAFAAGTITGGNSPICSNTNAGILTGTAPTGGAPGTTLQWESSTDGITYTNVTGQTTLTLPLGNLTQTMWYRLRYDNSCGSVYSNIINIVVYTPFVQGTISAVGSTTICNGVDFGSFTGTLATGGDPTTTYQWQFSIDGGTSWTNIAGEIFPNYDPSNLTVTTIFRRQDVNICGTLYTNQITITVYPVFNPGIIGLDQHICYASTPNQLTFLTPPSGGDGTYTYQWNQSLDGGVIDPWTAIIGATANTYQPPSLTSDEWYQVIVTSGCGSAAAGN